MSNQFNKIVVLDLEATCWDDNGTKAEFYRKSEIIEIGICEIDVTKGIIDNKRSIYVKPIMEYNQTLSDFCVDLTGITVDTLEKRGKYLPDAIAELRKHYPTSKTWGSWGGFDLTLLKKNCEEFRERVKSFDSINVDVSKYDMNDLFPFNESMYINFKNLYGLMRKMKRSPGMKKALELENLTLDGKHHSGKDDAANTAKIVQKLLFNKE